MALGALTLSTPSWPGSLYIPVVDAVNGNGTTPSTQLWLTNPALTQRQATLTFLPENTNGTVRTNNPGVNLNVPAKGSMRVAELGANSRIGMLEVDFADASLLQAARLARNITELPDGRTMVPVVSSANLVAASQSANLVGLMHVDNRIRTDIGIMNLGQTAATCTVGLFLADGTQAGATATLTFPPLSLRHFPNVLSDQPNVTDARAQVSCNTDFYAYATVHGPDGQLDYFITPALSGSSTLVRPGSSGPPKGCTTGAVCFDFPGVVHISTKAHSRPLDRADPAGRGLQQGEGPPRGADQHLQPALQRRARGPVHGPGQEQGHVRERLPQGTGREPTGAAPRLQPDRRREAEAREGLRPDDRRNVHVDYLYDPVAKTIVLTMSLNGQEVTRITDKPNVNRVHIDPGQKIVIGLSNPGTEAPEPASLGWVYKNLHIELIP